MSSTAPITPGASVDTCTQEPTMDADLQHWFMAAQQGDEDYIRDNVSRFASKRNSDGRTALMIAAQYDMQEVISILIDKEGGQQTSSGLTALAIEITSGHQINPELFQKEGDVPIRDHINPGFLAVMSDNLDALQFIVQSMGDSTSGESLYLLDICIDNNAVCCLEYLLSVFRNIPYSYIDKLLDAVEKKPETEHRIIAILTRYKQSLLAANRSATTPSRVKKRSDSTPFVGSSLKRSTSVKVEPNSQSSSSSDTILSKHQSLRTIQEQEQMRNPIPSHKPVSPLTIADIAPICNQHDDQHGVRGTDQRLIAPPPKIDPVADMILSTTSSFPQDSNAYMGLELGMGEGQLGMNMTLGNDLLQPIIDQPGEDINIIYKADYAMPPGEFPIEDAVDDGTRCRDNHRCCIELACWMMKCDDLEQNNTHLYEQNAALHAEVGELRQKIIKLETQLEQRDADNEALKRSLDEAKLAAANALPIRPNDDVVQLEASIFDLHSTNEPEADKGHLVEKLQMYIMKSRRLEHENLDLKQKLEESAARIHALERENMMKGRLNQLLTEDNRRSREQSRCASVISRSESVLSPGNTFMDSMAVGLEDSIMEMITSKLTDRTKLESNILRRKVAELRADMSHMLEDIMIISSYSMDLLPLPRDGGVYTANLRERANRLERQSNTDSVKVLFKRHADLVIDCMTYLKSVRDGLHPDEDEPSEPDGRSKSRNRSKSRGKTGRAPSRSLFGAILHKIGLGGE